MAPPLHALPLGRCMFQPIDLHFAGIGVPASVGPPEGVQLQGSTATVRADAPPHAALAWANHNNKKRTRGAKLPETFDISVGGQQAAVGVAELWAALRGSGGLHVVRAAPLLLPNKAFCMLRALHDCCPCAQQRALIV